MLGVAPRTFEEFLRKHKKARETWEMGRERAKASLRRTQFRLAENNVTMAIWLGKQLLGQRDQFSHEHDVRVDVNLDVVRAKLQADLQRIADADEAAKAGRLIEGNGSAGKRERPSGGTP